MYRIELIKTSSISSPEVGVNTFVYRTIPLWHRISSWSGFGVASILFILIALRNSISLVSLASSPNLSNVVQELVTRNRALLALDTQILINKAAGRLDGVLDPLFTIYHKRVPDFAAWAFQWRTSYTLLRRGVLTTLSLPFTDAPKLQHLGAAWDELIAEKFDELVLRPAGGDFSLRSARSRWEVEVSADTKAMITNVFLTVALLQGQDLALWAWQPISIENTSTQQDAEALTKAIGAVTTPIKIHAVRPLLTRLTLRPPIAATVTVVGEFASSYGDFGFLGTITGFAATVAGFLSVDYLISRVDAAISQQDLELEIHRALDAEHERLRQDWLAQVEFNIKMQAEQASKIVDKIL